MAILNYQRVQLPEDSMPGNEGNVVLLWPKTSQDNHRSVQLRSYGIATFDMCKGHAMISFTNQIQSSLAMVPTTGIVIAARHVSTSASCPACEEGYAAPLFILKGVHDELHKMHAFLNWHLTQHIDIVRIWHVLHVEELHSRVRASEKVTVRISGNIPRVVWTFIHHHHQFHVTPSDIFQTFQRLIVLDKPQQSWRHATDSAGALFQFFKRLWKGQLQEQVAS